MDTVKKTFRIQRFDAEKDSAPRWQDFTIECSPKERILTVLNRIKWEEDGSVSTGARSVGGEPHREEESPSARTRDLAVRRRAPVRSG